MQYRLLEAIEKSKSRKALKINAFYAVEKENENENKALIRKGRREGRRETAIEIAKNMLKEKVDINIIMKVTGLTEKQIIK